MDFIAASLPSPSSHDATQRAETVATLWWAALSQGLSPRRVLTAVYDLPISDNGERTEYSTTLERWTRDVRRRRTLPSKFDPERDIEVSEVLLRREASAMVISPANTDNTIRSLS
jgi:hypothetical protein